jgi:glycosyltransferase involved in cell wall biosynthesis
MTARPAHNPQGRISPLKLSVIVPVYNERSTISTLLERVLAVDLDKQLVVVDDCSTDGTRELLLEHWQRDGIVLLLLPRNTGKGAAVAEGLKRVTGDVVVIQDADLEYDPEDYHLLLKPILTGRAKAVYGSRFIGEHRAMYFWHAVGNRFLTLITNILFDTTLTDMETCYKMFTADIAHKLSLRSPRWGVDPEITAKILRMGHRIYEVPISYAGREYYEGKKISWWDAFVVLFTLLRFRFLP